MTITVQKIKPLNTLVIKQEGKNANYFILSRDAIIISEDTLVFLINFLVKNNYLNYKILEGIVEECRE